MRWLTDIRFNFAVGSNYFIEIAKSVQHAALGKNWLKRTTKEHGGHPHDIPR